MPASYVHQCVAMDALASLLPQDDASLLAAARAGAEGPDPLFFSLAPNPGGAYPPLVGNTIHKQKTDEFLLALLDACKNSGLLQAYYLGFLTHYATDTTFHPFVYAHSLTADGTYSGTEHCLLEHRFETLHYRRTGHASGLPTQFAGYLQLSPAQKDDIARALSAAIAKVFSEFPIRTARVRRSFDDAIALCKLLRSEGGTKFRVLGGALSPFRLDRALHAHMMPLALPQQDIANDAHAPWASIWEPDKMRYESFPDLYANAVARSTELANCVHGVIDGKTSPDVLRALTGGLSYDSGLPWRHTCPADEAPGVLKGA